MNRELLASRVVNIAIGLFWLYLLVDAWMQGRALPEIFDKTQLPALPVYLAICAILAFSLVVSAVTFWQRNAIMQELPIVTKLTDRLFGAGAYAQFVDKLRPVLTSILTSLVVALVGLYSTYESGQNTWSYAISFGCLAFSACMFVAYLISRRYPPILK